MIRAGIIGAGRIAWSYDGGCWNGARSVSHAACLHRHPDTQLVAILDPVADSRAAFTAGYKGPGPVTCHNTMAGFLAEDLDLVVVASPSNHHKDHILACLQVRIPRLLLEKPVVLTQDDFQTVVQAHNGQAAPKTQTTVNYFRRFLPQTAHLKDYVKKAHHTQTLVRVDITYSRGLDVNGVHLLDLLGHFFDSAEVPTLDWTDRTGTPDPSFGLTVHGCPVGVTGLPDLGYHGLDIRVTTQDGQMSLIRNGLDVMYAPKIGNPDYPGFYHLDFPRPAIPRSQSTAAMRDGTYLALCDLIEGSGLSPLDQSGFAQHLLDAVQDT